MFTINKSDPRVYSDVPTNTITLFRWDYDSLVADHAMVEALRRYFGSLTNEYVEISAVRALLECHAAAQGPEYDEDDDDIDDDEEAE